MNGGLIAQADQVEVAVAIEVAEQGGTSRAAEAGPRAKATRPVAQEDLVQVADRIGGHEVEVAVAINIAEGGRIEGGRAPDRARVGGEDAEAVIAIDAALAIAAAEEHVLVAVAVEVGDAAAVRQRDAEVGAGGEGARAVVEQQGAERPAGE